MLATAIVLRTDGIGFAGTMMTGDPTSGHLMIGVARPDDELPVAAIDVRGAGAIVVAGARIDVEALTRARAMGVRGVVVGGVVGRGSRSFAASEARREPPSTPSPPFALLVLDGFGKRPIPPGVWAALIEAEGREVGIAADPAMIVLDAATAIAPVGPDRVRAAAGEMTGGTGRLLEVVGRRRLAAGVMGMVGRVAFDAGSGASRRGADARPGGPGAPRCVTAASLAMRAVPVRHGRRDAGARAPPRARRPGRRPDRPHRAARRGQDGAGQGLRGRSWRARDGRASPSFTLMAEYRGRLPLFHLDLYRVDGAADAFEGGLLDEREAEGVTLIEWGDRLAADVDPGASKSTWMSAGATTYGAIEVIAATVDQARFAGRRPEDGAGSAVAAANPQPGAAAADH